MVKVILLNDVHSEHEKNDLIVGPLDSTITDEGVQQCNQIASRLGTMFPTIDMITASDSSRITKLLHRIRMKCKVKQSRIKYSPYLRERDFGVLNGTNYIFGLSSDMFRHSRICAEGGESVAQCYERAVEHLKQICAAGPAKSILCVTHPFTCQAICNHICNKKITALTKFWTAKGAFMVAEFSKGFKPVSFHHSHEDRNFTMEEVYGEEI